MYVSVGFKFKFGYTALDKYVKSDFYNVLEHQHRCNTDWEEGAMRPSNLFPVISTIKIWSVAVSSLLASEVMESKSSSFAH
jgi:hypothetical protein